MDGSRIRDLTEASRALESTLVKQLLESSGAFKGSGVAGSQIHAQMFMEVLAEAVTKSGGFGLATMLEKSLGPKGDGQGVDDAKDATSAALTQLGKLGRLDENAQSLLDSLAIGGKNGKPTAGLAYSAPADSLKAFAPLPERRVPDTATALLTTPSGNRGNLPLEKHSAETQVRTTSGFGPRVHPIDGTRSFHTGMDLAAPEGTAILAAQGGVVRSAGPRGGYGNAVEIDHGNGVTSLYAHASTVLVKPGDVVNPGEPVAEVGATGRATGPHLHFEVRVEGKAIDPKKALNAYGIRAESTVEESRKQASTLP
jgi:murein DD-endopeptidase MepM/ murein hydrolase activator NlpD